jgi:hypothetical protein
MNSSSRRKGVLPKSRRANVTSAATSKFAIMLEFRGAFLSNFGSIWSFFDLGNTPASWIWYFLSEKNEPTDVGRRETQAGN